MNLNTITEVKRPASAEEIPDWREGYAWLAGGTWLFSTPQIATHTLIDLESLRWPALAVTPSGLDIAATCTIAELERFAGAGSVDRCAAVAALLPCAADVVQDLQCGDSRREHLSCRCRPAR